MFWESPIKVNLSLGDHERGKVVSDSSTLGYNWAIRSTCWLVSEFEDEQVGLLPAAILFTAVRAWQMASSSSAKQHGISQGTCYPGQNHAFCLYKLDFSEKILLEGLTQWLRVHDSFYFYSLNYYSRQNTIFSSPIENFD